ncbi:MAG TPA: response regulator [Bacteroidia bacterium]|nr:response regulator [Bacteroidia bacterium]
MESQYNYKRVLLVDDVELDNFVAETIIRIYKFAEIIHVHTSGESALSFLKENANTNGQFPDVIFVDINMPVMDGFLFIENLKRDLKNSISTVKPKLVMLTSSVYVSDLQRAKQGFEDIVYIVKPLTEETLKLI